MLYQWLITLKKPSNQLWVTPTYWAVFTAIYVFSLRIAARSLNENLLPDIPLNTVEALLNVISSTMLAVSTFSLSIMVSAFASASNNATPRAIDLVMGDQSTRTAISSFICAFIYSIIAKIALGMEFYEQNGRFILFTSTILVLVYLIGTLIRWVYTLSQLGRLGNTLTKISNATEESLRTYRLSPNMYATRKVTLHESAIPLIAKRSGYLTHIDMATLQEKANYANCNIHINVRPGELISPDTQLCLIDGTMDNLNSLQESFVLSNSRTFEQDPSWGFIVFSEAAQRALSPAVNDPGTAINIMATIMSLLVQKTTDDIPHKVPNYDRLSIVKLNCSEWIYDSFTPISRDGVNILEMNLVMQKVLASIWRNAPESEVSQAAFDMAKQALQRCEIEMTFQPDIDALRKKHLSLFINNPEMQVKK